MALDIDTLCGIVKVLQMKVDNQKNEINDLSRKLASAKRSNRGLQRKKDLRGNLIRGLSELAVYLEDELEEKNRLCNAQRDLILEALREHLD